MVKTILVVDDYFDIVVSVKQVLEDTQQENSESLQRIVGRNVYNFYNNNPQHPNLLFLLDIMMPRDE